MQWTKQKQSAHPWTNAPHRTHAPHLAMPSTARMIPCQLLAPGGGCCLSAYHLGVCHAIDEPVDEPLAKRARKTPLRIADCECPPAKAPRVEAPTAPALAPRIEEAEITYVASGA